MNPLFIDHILIMVKDLNKTKKFYSKLFGKPIHIAKDSVAWQFGDTKVFFGLPFKEVENNFFDRNKIGLNHLAWGVRTLDELKQWKRKLDEIGIANSGILIDRYGNREYIWFDDPDGIRQELYFRPEKKE